MLCLILGILNAAYYSTSDVKRYTYDYIDKYSPALSGFLNIFTYFLLLNTMVPISLVVSLELIKLFQAFFISWDSDMFSIEAGKGCVFKSTSITEELGMVDYIFSDKTGTLTRNIMEFKAFVVGSELYG